VLPPADQKKKVQPTEQYLERVWRTHAIPMKPSEENKSATKAAKSMIKAELNKAIFCGLSVSAATMREAPAILTGLIGQFDYKALALEKNNTHSQRK